MLNSFLLIIGATNVIATYCTPVFCHCANDIICFLVFVTVQMISHIIQVSHDKNGQNCKTVISFIDHVAMKNVFYCIYSNMSPILWMRQGNIYDNIPALLGYTNFVL